MESNENKAQARKEDGKAQCNCSGKDMDGRQYGSISVMWDAEAPDGHGLDASSTRARRIGYDKRRLWMWMLAGLGYCTAPEAATRDIAASCRFLESGALSRTGRRGRDQARDEAFAITTLATCNRARSMYVVVPPSCASEEVTTEEKVGLRIAADTQDFSTVDGDVVVHVSTAYTTSCGSVRVSVT